MLQNGKDDTHTQTGVRESEQGQREAQRRRDGRDWETERQG